MKNTFSKSIATFLFNACILQTALATTPPEPVAVEDIQRFTSVVEHVKNYYVNNVTNKELFENAIRGMLSGLDPHSAYLDRDEFSDLKVSTAGQFSGIGIEITLEDSFIRIISPIDGTPAERAGIQAGDVIVHINDTPVKGLSLRQSLDMLRGKRGSKVVLTILRKNEISPIKINIIRDMINVQCVRSRMLDKRYGYIRVSQFQGDTGDELLQSIKKLQSETKGNLQGLILDLRNNPGGVVDASVQVADAFLDHKKLNYDGVIVYTKGRLNSSQIQEFANSKDRLHGAPIVVLVNNGSASAAEIVAGALQDHKRAIIMGTETFGKGSVQTILPLKEQRGLKLTTALYYTPSGKSIQTTGIKPDINVEQIIIETANTKENFWVREEDLKGHIKKSDKGKNKNQNQSNGQLDTPLVNKDYQLHEALNLLKGMHFLNETVKYAQNRK